MNLPSPDQLLPKMAADLRQYLQQKDLQTPRFIGIRTGGVWVAEALLKALNRNDPLGILDVSFYRDDFTHQGLNPQVRPSELPFAVEGEALVVIDDVLMSGRTVRAALNELFDYGRPASVTLVCLLDLNDRELPIRPDIVGATLALDRHQRIKLNGPNPLTLELQTLPVQ